MLTDAEARITFRALTKLIYHTGVHGPEGATLIEARRLLEVELRMTDRDELVEQLHADSVPGTSPHADRSRT